MISTRIFLAGAAALGLSSGSALAQAAPTCGSPVEVQGFRTCADVSKAESEGALVLYSPGVEPATAKLLADFQLAFPKIKTAYVRMQTGALYARIMTERQAGTYLADIVHLSDASLAQDFQTKKGFAPYGSPQLAAYKPEFKSQPEGYWTWGGVIMAGISYNPNFLKGADIPQRWADVADPRYDGGVSVKSSNSGLQFITWELLKRSLGDDFWTRFSKLKPKPFDSFVQQYDRVVNGEDKLAVTAQYSGYLMYKARNAPLEFIAPKDGLPAGPEVWGVAASAPHPEAARLFLDWFLSPLGQKVQAEHFYLHSPRSDVSPPPGGKPIDELTLLFMETTADQLQRRRDFVRAWAAMSGLR